MTTRSKTQPKFRWNAEEKIWEHHVPSWGGWNTLRIGPHESNSPMTFEQGCEYLRQRGEDPRAYGAPAPQPGSLDEVDSAMDRFKRACYDLEYSPFDEAYGSEYVAARAALRSLFENRK